VPFGGGGIEGKGGPRVAESVELGSPDIVKEGFCAGRWLGSVAGE